MSLLIITYYYILMYTSMLLFLVFFPRAPIPGIDQDAEDADPLKMPTWKEAVLVLAVSVAFFVFALIGSVVFVYAAPAHVRGWANFLGLLATGLAAVQYIPQIITTWRLQEPGSLSVLMMCIQTPGSFVFAASLYARLGVGGWSAWGLFIFTGCVQGCLLAMSLSFLWRDGKEQKRLEEEASTDENSERTPLLVTEDIS